MMVMKMMTTVMTMNVEGANVFYHLPTNVQCIMDCGGIAAVADLGESPPPIF